jgi:hypothetical protein
LIPELPDVITADNPSRESSHVVDLLRQTFPQFASRGINPKGKMANYRDPGEAG